MSNPKKPASRRQGRETKDIGLLPQIQVDPRSVPIPPAHLTERWVRSWEVFWASPFAQVVQPAQYPALERLFSMYEERERMDTYLREEPMTVGSQGQKILNPMYRQRTSVDAEIRQLEDRFGLHPKAGLQLGIVYGEAARSLEELNARITNATIAEANSEADPRYIDSDAVEGSAEEAALLVADQ
jgi:P27 family predicted phage terminase small subunit